MFLVDGVGLMDFWRITVLRHACFLLLGSVRWMSLSGFEMYAGRRGTTASAEMKDKGGTDGRLLACYGCCKDDFPSVPPLSSMDSPHGTVEARFP